MDKNLLKSVTLHATSAVVLGANAAGASRLHRLVLRKNGTAVTATVTGFQDESGTARSRVYTGSTSADVVIDFGLPGELADKGALTVQASIADLVDVTWSAQ